MADKNKTGDFYSRPEKTTSKNFIWNSETGQFLGRTGGSWGRILLFYVIFYVALAAFAAGLFFLFDLTLKDERPKYVLEESLIGVNPGLGFRPMPPESSVESTLVWFKNDSKNIEYWVGAIDEFLKPFEKSHPEATEVDCLNHTPGAGQVCKVSTTAFGPCTRANNYGFLKGQPCIFLKLNKIFEWLPEYYKKDNLPDHMPEQLKQHIQKAPTDEVVWVSCEGEYPGDKENIGEIRYHSQRGAQGFSGQYYPFTMQKGYKQPLIAVQFISLTKSAIVNVECKAWAENIKHDRTDRRGSVHFELMVDVVKP